MRGFSKAIVAGNVTRDPELRATPSGQSVCSFTIAVNRVFKGADGSNSEQTSFIDCSAWGKPGETIAQYIKKGSPLLVSGRLSQHSWDDTKTGQKRSRTEVVVEDFTFIGSGAGDSTMSAAPSAAPADDFAGDDGEDNINLDDIPF